MKKNNYRNWKFTLICLISVILTATIVITLFLIPYYKDKIEYNNYYNKKIDAFTAENDEITNVDIVFVGDEMIENYNVDAYFHQYSVSNRGIKGDTANSVASRMKVSIYDLNPSLVVLEVGINDLDGCVNGYKKILNGIKTNLPETNVIVQSIYPTGGTLATLNEKIDSVNAELEQLTYQNGYCYLNVNQVLKNFNNELDSKYSDDGININQKGYTYITTFIKNVCESYISE